MTKGHRVSGITGYHPGATTHLNGSVIGCTEETLDVRKNHTCGSEDYRLTSEQSRFYSGKLSV